MVNEKHSRWKKLAIEDKDVISELIEITGNENEISERFAVELTFGTAGLRGILGAGTNRMNIYTVRQATQGLANYLLKSFTNPSVAIAYDSRNKSTLFSQTAASVLAGNGVKVYIYKTLMPTPALSYAVRSLKCSAGIMVTASHNPAKYNGYKAYGADGCQMTSESADAVYTEMQKTDVFEDVKHINFSDGLENKSIIYIDDKIENEFYEQVLKQRVRPEATKGTKLKVVFTPLNGTGNLPVKHILKEIGITDVTVVKEQEMPDGDFTTCPYPNPEIKETLQLGLDLAKKINADLLIATDPDADRVGIAIKTKTGHRLVTGNEVGVLLLDYICKARIENGSMPKNPLYIRSIVTTNLADKIAEDNNVEPVVVLTGFKYIGETIHELEKTNRETDFILGFEESYGYLAGTYVRDKDAVVASMLICEMAAYYEQKSSSIAEELDRIYAKYGSYFNKVNSFEFEGLAGMEKMKTIMQNLRETPPKKFGDKEVLVLEDYSKQEITNLKTGEATAITLPKANVLLYKLTGGDTVIIRPSGTEPKIKVYYSVVGDDFAQAEKTQQILAKTAESLLS